MNVYQALNKSYRDFKVNESKMLKESEVDSNETVKDLDNEIMGLEDQLKQTTSYVEKKQIQERIDELKKKLMSTDEGANCENCSKEECDSTKMEEAETTVEVPIKVEVGGNEVVNPEVTTEPTPEVTEEPTDEIVDSELNEKCDEVGHLVKASNCMDEIINIVDTEGSIDSSIARSLADEARTEIQAHYNSSGEITDGENCDNKECDSSLKEQEDNSEKFTECEVKSFKVTRMAPSTNSYMLEAETSEGLKYIVGKNYDKESNTLDEAEMFDDKNKASNHFKKLITK